MRGAASAPYTFALSDRFISVGLSVNIIVLTCRSVCVCVVCPSVPPCLLHSRCCESCSGWLDAVRLSQAPSSVSCLSSSSWGASGCCLSLCCTVCWCLLHSVLPCPVHTPCEADPQCEHGNWKYFISKQENAFKRLARKVTWSPQSSYTSRLLLVGGGRTRQIFT